MFVLIATLTFISSWPIVYMGDTSQPAAEIFAPWIRSAKASSEGDESSRPARSIPYFTANAKQVYVNFYTAAPDHRPMIYRWLVDQKLQREFTLNYENGSNIVPLSDKPSEDLPVGMHEVYLSSEGVSVVLVRFRVTQN